MISKVYRNALVIIAIILVLSGGTIFLMESSLHVTNSTGVVVTFSRDGQQAWGLRADFRFFRPFVTRTLQFTNFDNIQQYEGKHVRVQYETVDVIGSDEFDVFVRLIHVERL